MRDNTLTTSQLIRAGAARLSGFPTPMIDARVLFQHVSGFTDAEIILSDDKAVSDETANAFDQCIERRLAGEPIAYIRGVQDFYLSEFIVTPDVLIPRPETEMLVERAIELAPRRILDLGVGSGCILASILSERLGSGADIYGEGWDISEPALAVARRNIEKLHLSAVSTLRLRSFADADDHIGDQLGAFDLIVSNPPYIEAQADLPVSVKQFEPASALFAGDDGLDAYRTLAPTISKRLTPDGWALLEIGTGQGAPVSSIMSNTMPTRAITVTDDLAGHQRMVSIHPEGTA